MTLDAFKQEVRLSRGKLTKFDGYLEIIYNKGISRLKQFTLHKKLMGIANIAWVAMQDREYQHKFCDFMEEKDWKATKNELDLWFSVNIGGK